MKNAISQVLAENFQKDILDEKIPVLLLYTDHNSDFPHQFSVLQNYANQSGGTLKIGRLAEEFMPAFQESYRITGTPTFLLFDHGRETGRLLGRADLQKLTDWISGLCVLR
jgi:thioredoxin-like negative regulator of GroEL